MWKIKYVKADNFMSYETLKYEFKGNCYVILAENLDDSGQSSNGAAKTSFVDTVAISLLGYSLSGRNTRDMVRWSGDESYFTLHLEMENAQQNMVASIERKFYSNTRSAELIILVNGEVPAILPSKKGVRNGVDVREGNKFILSELLDITEEDLLNYFLIGQAHYNPFLKVNTDRKLEVISRFTNTEVVDKAISSVDTMVAEKEVLVEDAKTYINTIDGYITALEDQMTEEGREKWEIDRGLRVKAFLDEIFIKNLSIEDLRKKKMQYEVAISNHIIEEFSEADRQEAQTVFNDIKTELEAQKQNIKEHESFIAKLENHLAGLIECPKCNHKFNLQSDYDISEDDLEEARADLVLMQAALDEMDNNLQDADTILYGMVQTERSNAAKQREIESYRRMIKTIDTEIGSINNSIYTLESAKQDVMSLSFEDTKSDLLEKILEKREERERLEKEIETNNNDRDFYNDWSEKLSDFKFFLGNKPLKIICGLINHYLKLSGSDLNLDIEGFKKLRSGELRQSLEPVVYRNWLNGQKYTNFSAGEQCRLNLATDLAFQQLINSASKTGGLGFYCSDEGLSNLDSRGVQNIANSFNGMGKTILLVTHSGSDLLYDNTIKIIKQNGISRINI